MMPDPRAERFHASDRAEDQRGPFQRDRDRIIYTSAFRRLAWVTQVVSAHEGDPFHNRLTHTLEVAQIGKRLAEKLLRQQPDEAETLGGIDPEVVEAAALAHDLGHPPFGHAVEKELDTLVQDAGLRDGFEGNPQSFRVVTKLAVRGHESLGLNLTKATLNAILKYPWFRTTTPPQRSRKWGAYHIESAEFEWVRGPEPRSAQKSVEAEVMDFADDIAYAIHDMEDFYRTGLIPLDRLVTNDDERDKFLDGTFSSLQRNNEIVPFPLADCRDAFAGMLASAPVIDPYSGTRKQRASLRTFTAGLIGRYINAIKLQVPSSSSEQTIEIKKWAELELWVFKQLTWHYVINNSALASQQFGQRRIIKFLFVTFNEAAADRKLRDIFPTAFREQVDDLEKLHPDDSDEGRIRLVTDLLASLTENQAMSMYQRLSGTNLGTVLDMIVR